MTLPRAVSGSGGLSGPGDWLSLEGRDLATFSICVSVVPAGIPASSVCPRTQNQKGTSSRGKAGRGAAEPVNPTRTFSLFSERGKTLLVVGPNFISVLQLGQDPLEGSLKHRLRRVKAGGRAPPGVSQSFWFPGSGRGRAVPGRG